MQSTMTDHKVPLFNPFTCKLFILKFSVFQGSAIAKLLAKLIYRERLTLLN